MSEKTNFEKNITDLKNQIDQLKIDNQENAHNLEKQYLIEKTRLKNQMIEKLNEIANEFRNALFEKIDNTTKKVIRENFLLNSHNKIITDQINKLIKENEFLKEMVHLSNFFLVWLKKKTGSSLILNNLLNKNVSSKLERETFKDLEEEITKKYVTSKKVEYIF